MAREIIAHRIPFPFQPVQHVKSLQNCPCQSAAVRCRWIQMQRALQNFACVLVWIPACNQWHDCLCVCVHACVQNAPCLRTGAALGSHTAAGTGTPTYFMVCVWESVWDCVCVQLEPLHVTAPVPSCPFTRNDWLTLDTHTRTHTHNLAHTLPEWVTSDMGFLMAFSQNPFLGSQLDEKTMYCTDFKALPVCVCVCVRARVCLCAPEENREWKAHLSKE